MFSVGDRRGSRWGMSGQVAVSLLGLNAKSRVIFSHHAGEGKTPKI